MKPRHFLTLNSLTHDELLSIINRAMELKKDFKQKNYESTLANRVLGMIFEKSSTRTRVSFEAGMAQLGGHGAFIDSNTTQISHGDTPVEIGEIFGRYLTVSKSGFRARRRFAASRQLVD